MITALFILYTAALTVMLCRSGFVRRSGLSWQWIASLFLLKAAAAVAIGYISNKYYPQGNDYWNLHRYGVQEFQLLKDSPGEFFRTLFYSPYGHYGNFFSAHNSYWNDLESNLLIKLLAVINFLGRENYYLNSLFFSAIGFIGHVALYRAFRDHKNEMNILLVFACFLVPSTLYFSSGIHKDCIVFTLTGLIIYGYAQWNEKEKGLWLVIISLLLLLLLRNYLALIIAGLLVLFVLPKKMNWPRWTMLPVGLAAMLMLSFTPLDPFRMLASRQQNFLELPVANSQMEMTPLEPGLTGSIKNLPEAFVHGFLRPYPGEFESFFLDYAAIEMYMILLLILIVLVRNFKRLRLNHQAALCFFLAIVLILMAGYIVPNAGTLIRYRSLYLPLLLTSVLMWRSKSNDRNGIISNE